MVLKKTKDVFTNTGNTQRTKNTKFYRNIVRQGIILRESGITTRSNSNHCRDRTVHKVDLNDADRPSKCNQGQRKAYKECLPDPDLTCCASCDILDDANILDNIPYSINKKGRWHLESKIKNVIFNERTCSTVLTETCTIFKSSRTECFLASNSIGEVFDWTCMARLVNEESILEDFLKQEQRVETKIRIFKPYEDGSCSGSICSNHKITGFDAVKRPKLRKYRKGRVHRKSDALALRDEFYMLKGLFSSCVLLAHGRKEHVTVQPDRVKLGFNFVGNFGKGNKPRTKSKRKKSKQNKNEQSSGDNSIENDLENRMDPVTVLIPCQDVLPASLIQNYGDDYVECPCYPRRFIINVTERLEYHMLTSGCWKGKDINKLNINSCITFSECIDSHFVSKVEGFSKFRVNFNIQTQNNVVRILTLSDKFHGGISDIIQKTLYYINMISESEMTTATLSRSEKNKMDQPFKILNMFLKVDVKYDTFSIKSLFLDLFTSDRCRTANRSKVSSLQPKSVFDLKTCAICFNDYADSKNKLLMMTSCNHTFCECCWLRYINCRLNTAFVNIKCPEYNCSFVIPDTLLLTFISVSRVVELRKRRQELALLSSGLMKWCPNRKCSHALRVTNSLEATSISCICGITFCFNCLTNAHWPLSCDYTSVYREQLKGSKVGKYKQLHVIDKNGAIVLCPSCSIPIERVGTGIFMTCICGEQFCWGCLKVYPKHEVIKTCFMSYSRNNDNKKVETKEQMNKRNKKDHSQYFTMALSHRMLSKNQNTFNKLKNAVTRILLQCKNMPLKRCPSFLTIIVRFDDSERKGSNHLAVKDRISGALWELLTVYKDFHYIAEYALILMDELKEKHYEKSTIHLPGHINQLNLYAENIASLVKSSDYLSDYRLLIETLLALEKQCQSQMKQFISVIRKLK